MTAVTMAKLFVSFGAMDVAAVAALYSYGDAVAIVAFHRDREDVVLIFQQSRGLQAKMLFTDILRRENADEWGISCRLFHRRSSVRFLSFYEAGHGDDVESKFLRRFKCLDGRGSRGADVIDDDDLGALFAETFNPLCHAVLLFCFTNQEAMNESVAERLAVTLLSAEGCHGDDDRVGAHRKAANRVRVPSATADLVEENTSGQLGAIGMKGGGAAVDVVITCAAAGELEFP